MNREQIESFAAAFALQSEFNRISIDAAISPELAGIQMFDAPLVGYSSVADPLYAKMKEPGVVGEHFRLPQEWLKEGKTVISFFFPFTEEVRKSNLGGKLPSSLWLHGRIEGQRFLGEFASSLAQAITDNGGKAVVPILSPEFDFNNPKKNMMFNSNWSERHVAYISGLGTFSLTRGLITEKGMAGRFVSLVTDIELEPTERPYSGINEYCLKCGACAKNCPVGAISVKSGKRQLPCGLYQKVMMKKYSPRYGCGKCQVGVPCEFANPKAHK